MTFLIAAAATTSAPTWKAGSHRVGRAFGGLNKHVKAKLEKIGATGKIPSHKRCAETDLAPGTTLVREYDGVTYRVKVMEDGRFDLDGRHASAWI